MVVACQQNHHHCQISIITIALIRDAIRTRLEMGFNSIVWRVTYAFYSFEHLQRSYKHGGHLDDVMAAANALWPTTTASKLI